MPEHDPGSSKLESVEFCEGKKGKKTRHRMLAKE